MMKQICTYCGSTWQSTDDHVQARIKGGKKTVPACRRCNQSKGKKPLMVWLRWLRKNRPSRWQAIKNYNYGRKNPIAQKVQKVRDEK